VERKPKVVRLIDLAEKIGLDLTEIHDEVSKRIYGAEVIEEEKEKGWIDIEIHDEEPKVVSEEIVKETETLEDWHSLTATQIHGRRVKPATDWCWGEQGGNGIAGLMNGKGTVNTDEDMSGWVNVSWDNGESNNYRHSSDGDEYDLEPLELKS